MPARRRLRPIMIAVAAVVIGVLAVVAGVVIVTGDRPSVAASSTRSGMDPSAVVAQEPRSGDATPVTTWASEPGTGVVWLRVTWPEERRLDRVRIDAGADGAAALKTGALEFGDGSALALSSVDGDVEVSFPARRTSSVTLVVTATQGDVDTVELGAWRMDSTGNTVENDDEPLRVRASASSGDADALTDGAGAEADQGREWTADGGDDAAWVELDWDEPREVASVQVFGPTGTWTDPAYAAAAPLGGTLVFDDGSRVVVSGIAGGAQAPTTLGFMPRIAKSVRLELSRTIEPAEFGLREFRIHPRGVTPDAVPAASSAGLTVEAAPATCSDSERATDAPLELLCPAVGTSFSGSTEVRVAASPGAELSASTLVASGARAGSVAEIASATADASGSASLRIEGDDLPAGPIGIRITASGQPDPLHIQLINSGGVVVEDPDTAPRNRTLILDEDFTEPLSVEQWGDDARYAATKPAYWGGSEFGEAIFADPAWGTDSLGTLDDDYLRLRAQPAGARADPYGWGRSSLGTLLSSLHVGGSGSAVQYGFFEARMLAPGGTGTWPAFWMQNTSSATRDIAEYGEIDAVELYGHDTAMSCHSRHTWRQDESGTGDPECLQPGGDDDWALGWRTYGVDIRPDGIDYYVDGTRVVSHEPVARQDEPFFYMVNLALGGGWPVDLSPTEGVADLYVDWIRVYA